MKAYFLAAALLVCLFTNAQTDLRFADSTAVWNLAETAYLETIDSPGIDGIPRTKVYHVEKDTFFNNHSYQKIMPQGWQRNLIRKDSTGRVYWFDHASGADKLIYDFGLEKGDTITLDTKSDWEWSDTLVTLVVDSVDSVFYGTWRKRLFLQCNSPHPCTWDGTYDTWIEGIGSLRSYFLRPYAYEPSRGIVLDSSASPKKASPTTSFPPAMLEWKML